MITSTIALPGSAELAALLRAEEGSFSHPRAKYGVAEKAGKLVVSIEAQDATALKTVVSSVCRVAAVYEKAKGV